VVPDTVVEQTVDHVLKGRKKLGLMHGVGFKLLKERSEPPRQVCPDVCGRAERGFDARKLLTQAPMFFS